MTSTYQYDVEILHLLVSPEHAYFGRARDGAVDVPTLDADQVQVVAGKGIVGDRFFGKAAHMDAAVTLLAVETLDAVARDLGVARSIPSFPGGMSFLGVRSWRRCRARTSRSCPVRALCDSMAVGRRTLVPGWTGFWRRVRTPRCGGEEGCAVVHSPTGSCSVGQRS